MEWIPAKVGCHWSSGEFYISTCSIPDNKESHYRLLWNREEYGLYKTLRTAQRAAEGEAKKAKWLVISYNTDDQTRNCDHVRAVSDDAALEVISELRPDCIPIISFSAKELLGLADDLIARPNTEIVVHMARLEQAAKS